MTPPDTILKLPDDDDIPHTSMFLRRLIDGTTDTEHFSPEWLIGHLPKNAFGFIVLLLALLSLVPIIDFAARLVILVLLCQIMLGYDKPILPRRFLARNLPIRYL